MSITIDPYGYKDRLLKVDESGVPLFNSDDPMFDLAIDAENFFLMKTQTEKEKNKLEDANADDKFDDAWKKAIEAQYTGVENLQILNTSMKCFLRGCGDNIKYLDVTPATGQPVSTKDIKLGLAYRRKFFDAERKIFSQVRKTFATSAARIIQFEQILMLLSSKWLVTTRKLSDLSSTNDVPFKPRAAIKLLELPPIFFSKTQEEASPLSHPSNPKTPTQKKAPVQGKAPEGSKKPQEPKNPKSDTSLPTDAKKNTDPSQYTLPIPWAEKSFAFQTSRAFLSVLPRSATSGNEEEVNLELFFPSPFADVVRKRLRLVARVTLDLSSSLSSISSLSTPSHHTTNSNAVSSLERLEETAKKFHSKIIKNSKDVNFIANQVDTGQIEELLYIKSTPDCAFASRDGVSFSPHAIKVASAIDCRLQHAQEAIFDASIYDILASQLMDLSSSETANGEFILRPFAFRPGGEVGEGGGRGVEVRAAVSAVNQEGLDFDLWCELESGVTKRVRVTLALETAPAQPNTFLDCLGALFVCNIRKSVATAWRTLQSQAHQILDFDPCTLGYDVKKTGGNIFVQNLSWLANILLSED